MSNEIEITVDDLSGRLSEVEDITAFEAEHGLVNAEAAFKVEQMFPPGDSQAAFRNALAALGYEFDENQTVTIVL